MHLKVFKMEKSRENIFVEVSISNKVAAKVSKFTQKEVGSGCFRGRFSEQ